MFSARSLLPGNGASVTCLRESREPITTLNVASYVTPLVVRNFWLWYFYPRPTGRCLKNLRNRKPSRRGRRRRRKGRKTLRNRINGSDDFFSGSVKGFIVIAIFFAIFIFFFSIWKIFFIIRIQITVAGNSSNEKSSKFFLSICWQMYKW